MYMHLKYIKCYKKAIQAIADYVEKSPYRNFFLGLRV